jgi:hypothetical protein
MATKKETDIIAISEGWFKKLPPVSSQARTKIVHIMPWLALIFGILGIVVSVAGLGVLTFLSPLILLGGGVHAAGAGIIGVLLGLVSSVLLLAAYPGLKAHKFKGWKLVYWSQVLGVISSLLSFSIVGILVGLVGIYLLFQIKSAYK